MKKLIVFIYIVFLIVNILQAQTPEVKLICKGKYSQAEKKILKSLTKDSLEIPSLFSKAWLLNERKYSGYGTLNAYISINKALRGYQALAGNKEQTKLDKSGLNQEAILQLRERIFDNALADTKVKNSIATYQNFIDIYKESVLQKAEAVRLRDILAFARALEINTEEAFVEFLIRYPQAAQRDSAILMRDTRGFETAGKLGTSEAYKQFILKYPNSQFYNQANDLYESALFVEQTDGSLNGFMRFCENYPTSKFLEVALDSVYSISSKSANLSGLDFIITNFPNSKSYDKSLQTVVDLMLFDGERFSAAWLDDHYSFKLTPDQQRKMAKVLENGNIAESLFINFGITAGNKEQYRNFIITTAPSELAWVCLQRLVEPQIREKKWNEAGATLDSLKSFFINSPWYEKIEKTKVLLGKDPAGVKVIAVQGINTEKEEYSPVPSFDGKSIYFCGKDRSGGLGGEDIFESKKTNAGWGKPELVVDLSTAARNEAPLCLSADGNTIITWSGEGNGDVMFSEKNALGGWSTPTAFPSPINTEYYEGDAMLTADGKALLFVSNRPGGRNLYIQNPENYHGDNLYPTDIYITVRGEDGVWGTPINLGAEINTPFSERSPYLHPDGKTLYFSSDGHYGLGRMDVFRTQKLNENSWTSWKTPENMGKEINTPDNDWGFKFSTDGKTVYYAGGKSVPEFSSLLLLLDISGSMSGSKIEALKTAASDVCSNAIANNSEVAIFTFDGDCFNPVRFWTGFSRDPAQLIYFIDNLQPGGRTPMFEAMKLACEYLKKFKSPDSKNQSIILLTDGDDNGCSNLQSTLSSLRSRGLLYRFQTIAFEVDEYSQAYADLTAISKASKGKFFHARSVSDLGTAFAEASTSLYNLSGTVSKKDIMQFNLPDAWRPDYVATISGKLLDRKDQPVEASIQWEDLDNGKTMGETKSDPVDGSYFIILPLGKIYGYYVDKPGVFPSSNNLDLRSQKDKVEVQVDVEIVSYQEMIEEQVPVPIKNIFFETGMYNLKNESIPELTRLSKIIAGNKGLKVEIAGHTDNVGTPEFNQELSEKRARAVADYLIKTGIDPNQLLVVGYGFSKPVADNSTESGRLMNRRVEFKFVK